MGKNIEEKIQLRKAKSMLAIQAKKIRGNKFSSKVALEYILADQFYSMFYSTPRIKARLK